MKKRYLIPLLYSLPLGLWAQTFLPLKTYSIAADAYPAALAMGDMNKDGYPDVVTSNQGPNQPSVLLNQKIGGAFGAAASYFSNAYSLLEGVAVGDVTGDGYPEVVTVDASGTLSLQYNANRGGLSGSVQYTVDDNALAVKLGDVNNDGYLDAITASLGYGTSQSTSVGKINVLLNTKRYTFAARTGYATTRAYSPYDVDLADLNNDGYLDMVVGFTESAIGVYLNKKDGTFAPFLTYPTGSSTHPVDIVLGDLNKDGYADVVATDRTRGAVEVLLNKKDGTFGPASSYSMGDASLPRGGSIGDITGDGFPDIVVANFNSYSLGILRNNQDGTFAPMQLLPLGNNKPTDTALSDVDKDGKLDIITTLYSGLVGVFLNTTPPVTLATLATTPFAQAQVSLYPNPAVGQATLVTAGNLPLEAASLHFALYNSRGQSVCRQLAAVAQRTVRAELPTTGLASGLYVLQLTAYDAQGVALGTLAAQRLFVR